MAGDQTHRSQPTIAVAPFVENGIVRSIEEAGASISDPASADAIIWLDFRDPEGLRDVLATSPARWVQLPMAGIERFFAAGVITPERTWTCAKGIYGYACAEHALALMLAAARRIHSHARSHKWEGAGFDSGHRMLKGSTVVVVGTGGIGASLMSLLDPFKVRVLAVNRSGRAAEGASRTVTTSHLAELLPETDFVVLAVAVTLETTKLFDGEMIARMPNHAWLINVARGAIVDTDALVDALRSGTIGGAALDVTDPEPLPEDHPLWSMDNVIITPHVANTAEMALPELRDLVYRNVKRFSAGETLEGLVDPDVGY